MDEFNLIETYFKTVASHGTAEGVVVGIGDDCAVLQPPVGSQLVVSADTLIKGVHFPEETSAFDVGYKALAVNLSDLAAMGATPLWFTLCISLPDKSESWLAAFCEGLSALVTLTGIVLQTSSILPG